MCTLPCQRVPLLDGTQPRCGLLLCVYMIMHMHTKSLGVILSPAIPESPIEERGFLARHCSCECLLPWDGSGSWGL
jgi:hypothetical protein